MTVIIFGDNFSFPEGTAGTNRIITYAKGFVDNNVNTYVICFKNYYTENHFGTIDRIKYFNPLFQARRNKLFLVRNFHKAKKYFNTIKIIRNLKDSEAISAVITDTQSFTTFIFSFLLSRYVRTKLIYEKSEHPLRLYQKNILTKLVGYIVFKSEAFLSDGTLCISKFLITFYKDHGVSEKKLLLVPSTVIPQRFEKKYERIIKSPYLGYFGGLTFKRDNIDILINAFASISGKHPEIQLVLGGFCSENEKKKIKELIDELKISSRTIILEYLPREEVVKYIVQSRVLVMVRGKDMESDASFPSKLTEYLATGIPIITVNVGEISEYLTDGLNSFIVPAADINALANKIDFVLDNYDLALEIAKKGKELTSSVFNYNYQSKRILNFIQSRQK